MNILGTSKRALPYLLLGVAFAVLAGQAGIGYCSFEEGGTLALVQRLYNGATPYVDEWLGIQGFAIVLLPYYTLWMSITGNLDTVIYFFRLIFILFVFIAAVFGYRVLRESTGEVIATFAALAAFLCLGSNNDGFSCYNLCALCLLLSGLCAWCTWLQMRSDDGTQRGYKRLLWPIACGVFAATAASCDLGILPLFIVSIATAVILAAVIRNPKILIPFAWAVLGYAVVLIIFAIYLLGFDDPALMADSMRAAFMGSHGLTFSSGAKETLGIPARQACVAIMMFCFVIAVGIVNETSILRHTLWQDVFVSVVLVIVVICCFCAGFAGHDGDAAEDITQGVFAADAAEIEELTGQIEQGDTVWCVTKNACSYLLQSGVCGAPTIGGALVSQEAANEYYVQGGHEYPEWILVQNQDAVDDESLENYISALVANLDNQSDYAPVKSNGFGTLYKRASAKTCMTQAN